MESDKGIEIDFGRRISPTVSQTSLIRKANIPLGTESGGRFNEKSNDSLNDCFYYTDFNIMYNKETSCQ